MRAIVGTVDGEVAGIIGVARFDGFGEYFSQFSEPLQPFLGSMTVWRAVKASMKFVESYRGVLYAIAQHAEGERNLLRLGFVQIDGELFLWPGLKK